ncbi:hypothetical protein HIV01_012325 [Lysobacter arenosi]|uniref:Uncharacterized protein n=1 Tax=Lysobacter arenosi TaxID=2795387 RepID=A0ABX7R7A3_9GAMM|nr:hypothetical protein [Lysobacter arenosi]QSX74003.1 hypothetical protein HIV01_012325 [Lysobacter arenosi]
MSPLFHANATMLMLGDLYTQLDLLVERSASATRYFSYVEEAGWLSGQPDNWDGPYGAALPTELPELLKRNRMHYRVRMSGPVSSQFLEQMGNFEELSPRPSPRQRERRLQHLRAHLTQVAMPVVDLYVSRSSDLLAELQTLLEPGSWHYLQVSDDAASPVSGSEPFVLVGDIPGGDQRVARIDMLLPVDPRIETRLRDIFSMKHIPDARFDSRGRENDRMPVPPAPLAPDLESTVAAASEDHARDPWKCE